MRAQAPLPPVELAVRIGTAPGNALATFDSVGLRTREEILELLPEDWTFEGKRVLDFGCGVGRTLRHFLDVAHECELHGCDIHAASVDWLRANLSPPLHVFRNGESPPLPLDRASFDLIWAISVFTHLADEWAAWLLELHRLLRPGGLLLATFHGPELSGAWAKAPPDDRDRGEGAPAAADRVGMNVLHWGRTWDLGGPAVFHSAWWLEEHWGRAFDVLELREEGFVSSSAFRGQGVALLRKRAVEPTVEELERIDPAEPREVIALRHNVRQLHNESRKARETRAWLESERAPLAAPRRSRFRRRR